jgi:4'-phosphopantetheinyl transferase EntD
VIERLLPGAVAHAEAFDDSAAPDLFPEEEAIVARAVDKRRLAFGTARLCARRALADIGVSAAPIASGEKGEPIWPEGVVGSITHCDGYRASAVAWAREVVSVGIDAEPNEPISEGVERAIALPEERDWLRSARAGADVAWGKLLFSAKESVYKAWFPLARRWLGFEEASIAIDPEAGTFDVRLLVPGPVVNGRPLTGFSGRWLAENGLVATAIALPAEDA